MSPVTVNWMYHRIEGEFPEERFDVVIRSANNDRQLFLPVQTVDLEKQLRTTSGWKDGGQVDVLID